MAINSSFRTLSADNMEGVVYARNYLKNSFENNSTTGWNKVSVSSMSGSVPASGSTISVGFASAVTTFAASATSPLNGKYSLNAASSAAWTAGQGFISDAFAIDRMDAGKVLTVSFDYELVSGTVNMSGTLGSQNFIVYIWDQTAGAWIQPAGFLGMNQSSGPGRVTCTFQSSVTAGQQYRVAVIASVATSGAVSLRFDNLTCSRQTAPIGPVVTDWVSYTPTGLFTTNTTYSGRWRRVGQNIEIDALVSFTGAPNAANATVSIPSGLSINTSALSQATQFYSPLLGSAAANDSGNGLRFHVNYYDTSSVVLTYQSSTGGLASLVTATVPVSWGNGDNIVVKFTAPISGWSSNVQLSNDTDTRVVAARYYANSSAAIPNSATVFDFGVKDFDTHSAVTTGAGWKFTAPVSGIYRVSASLNIDWASSPSRCDTALRRNGSVVHTQYVTSSSVQVQTSVLNTSISLNAGDYIDITHYETVNGGLYSGAGQQIVVERLSGPSVVAASETVAMRAIKNSGAQTSNNNLQNIASFNSIVQDTHGIFNLSTGVATVPISGTYLCTFQVSFVANSNGARVARLLRNGNMEAEGNIYLSWADRPVMIGTALLKCNAGDTLNLQAYQTSGGNLNYDTTLNNSTNFNIVRVGN